MTQNPLCQNLKSFDLKPIGFIYQKKAMDSK